jgi:hypothetical protein
MILKPNTYKKRPCPGVSNLRKKNQQIKRNLSQNRKFSTILHKLVTDFKKKLFTNYAIDYQLNYTLLGENDLLTSTERNVWACFDGLLDQISVYTFSSELISQTQSCRNPLPQ